MSAPKALAEATEYCPTSTRERMAEAATLILDVRSAEDVALLRADVPDWRHIPLEELETRYEELPRERDIVVVSVDGAQSLKGTYFLMYQGFTRVANMQMGLKQWVRREFPVIGDVAAWQAKHPAGESEGCC
ncbi:rhodanese-like domain-containing protein [Granulosicoccaceae sp. 1_MG-2023]|nr:rhodanese-like domain-containing protein [Granulosicoccaceae sp. 1_MG-2023]